MNTSNM